MCRSTTGCEWLSSSDGCVSSDEDEYEGGMNDNDAEGELRELTPPKPDWMLRKDGAK